MTLQTAKPSFINDSARCTYRFPNGRRCRLYIAEVDSSFCPAHSRLPENQCEPPDTATTLTANLTDFTSAAEINDFLSRLLLLLAQNRISPRKAAVLTYIASQLLRTLPAIDKQGGGPEVIVDMQRPERFQPDQDARPPALDLEKVV